MGMTDRPELYLFQRQGVDQMVQQKRNLLADDVGLGKTPQALSALVQIPNSRPAVVVCPARLRVQWKQEALKFVGINALILTGRKPMYSFTQLRNSQLLITSYEVLDAWLPLLYKIGIRTVIGDEIHRINSLYGKQSNVFRQLCINVPNLIFMSATPMVNYPAELWPVASTLWPEEFDSIFTYMYRYCEDSDGESSRRKWKGARNTSELFTRLKALGMIRRTKEQVLKQLPPLRRYVIPCELSDMREYNRAERDFIGWLLTWRPDKVTSAMRGIQFTKFSYMKRLTTELKLPAIMDWLDILLQNPVKVLIGAIHKDEKPRTIPVLEDRYKDVCVSIHGGKTSQECEAAKLAFQTSKECRILIGQVKACGEGHNLQAANCVVHTELPWNPATLKQFAGRAHRIGTLSPVDEYAMVGECPIEEQLCSLIQKKERWSSAILDGKSRPASSMNIFDALTEALLKTAPQ